MKRTLLLLACVLLSLSNYAQGNGEPNIPCRIIQMATDGDYLWLACDGGLIKYNKQTGKHTLFTRSNSGLCSDELISVACYNGKVLTGSQYDGFSEFDGITFTNYNMSNAFLVTNQHCKEVLYDSEGDIWLGALHYIYKYDGSNWEKFTLPNAKYSAWLSYDALKLSDDGTLWFGTCGPITGGSFGYITKDKEIKTVSPDMVNIQKIDIDKLGNVWYCSDKGIACYDGSNLKYYNSKNSPIANDLTYGLSVDDDNNIWFGSDNLLFKYDGTEFTSFQVPTNGRVFDLLVDGKAIWVTITHTGELFRFEDGKFESVDYSANTGIENGDDSLSQNDYIPFVEAGKQWHVARFTPGHNDMDVVDYYIPQGVEEINGNNYYKMKGILNNTTEIETYLVREENRKVYLYDPDLKIEYLMFDFSLKKGDTYETYSYESHSMVRFKVISVDDYTEGLQVKEYYNDETADTMAVRYRYLRKWAVLNANSGAALAPRIWIEGIGSLRNPFSGMSDGYYSSDHLTYIIYSGQNDNYLPFSFGEWWDKECFGCNLPTSAEYYNSEDGHHQLTYELEGKRLHVYGKVLTRGALNNYAYFIEEPRELTDDPLVRKFHFKIQEIEPLPDPSPDSDGMVLRATDFYVEGFNPAYDYIIVDNQGEEHHVINKAPLYVYRPFVVDGKVWVVKVISDGPPTEEWIEYYYLDGDTIVNGQTAKRMLCDRIASSQNISGEYVGAWYEQNKEIYFAASGKQQFELLYDFSLINYDTMINPDGSKEIVYKWTGINPGFKGTCYTFGNECWYEGVGSNSWPFVNHPWGYDGNKGVLLACFVGDEVIYYNSLEDDPYVMGARKRRFDFTHTTKIQPKARHRRGAGVEQSLHGEYNDLQLGINLDPLDDAYLVRITDESGKAVYEKNVNAGNIVGLNIDISSYAEGRYTITVENSLESFTGEFEAQPTGIREVRGKRSEVRDHIYNLQGQRISTLQKGLNIVNGQKVFVK